MSLTRVGNQPEGSTGAQFQVGDLHTSVNATNDQTFFALVKLECLAQFKLQRYKRAGLFAFTFAPRTDEISYAGIAALIAIKLDLSIQVFGCPSVSFVSEGIRLERLLQRFMEGGQFAWLLTPLVGRLRYLLGVSDPLAYRVARQTRALCNFMKRLLVAKKHPPNLTYHFHSDHLLSPALKLGRGSKTPGSIFGRHNAYIWVTFRSVSTDLQDRWAALLVNAANANFGSEVRRSYVTILEQLTPLDAHILDVLYSLPFEKSQHDGIATAELPLHAHIKEEKEQEFPLPTEDVVISLSNLARLGCLRPGMTWGGGESFGRVNPTVAGKAFVVACRPYET